MPQLGSLAEIPDHTKQAIIEAYATEPNPRELASRFHIPAPLIRRLVSSPQGCISVQTLVRDSSRDRFLKLNSLADRVINEVSSLLDRGQEVVLSPKHRKDHGPDHPSTIWIRPALRDLAYALQVISQYQDRLQGLELDAISDVSHDARRQNLEALQRLVKEEQRAIEHTSPSVNSPVESQTYTPVAGPATHPPPGRASPNVNFRSLGAGTEAKEAEVREEDLR